MSSNKKNNSQLSYGQKAMWFMYQIAPKSASNNIFTLAKSDSDLNLTVFTEVWNKIFERHPILRTTYTNYQGKPIQKTDEQQKLSIELINAKEWSEDELKARIIEATNRPFYLEKDSIIRISLFTQSEQNHTLLLTMHHICGDLRTLDLLLCEFQAIYPLAIEKGSQWLTESKEDLFPDNPLPKSYSDFVNWQLEMLSSAKGEKLWGYWQKKLAGELPILNLLTDKPRPLVKTYKGKTRVFKLEQVLIDKIKYLAQSSGISLYKILLTAFYVFIYHYTEQTDILIATPMRGRNGRSFQKTIGYFTNRVILRTSLVENATFTELLTQVSRTVREAQKHQHYPFSLLSEKLQQQRDETRSPLSQIGFTWQMDFTWHSQNKHTLSSSAKPVLKKHTYSLGHQGGADLDLNLIVIQDSFADFQLAWQYNTDLFETATIKRMAGHYVALLENIVTNPQQQICQLSLLTEKERQQLLVEWNQTQDNYSQDKSIHQLFEEQVERTPSSEAVIYEGEKLTYAELNHRANQLANYLQNLGIGTEEDKLVGLCVERSLEMVIGILGILKAGGAYLPLDPTYPQQRLTELLSDAQVSVLLTQQSCQEKLTSQESPVVYLDQDWSLIAQESPDNLVSQVKPYNLAYVIYTSGSTGKPKGVMIEHRSVVNLSHGLEEKICANREDTLKRVSMNASFGFDASVQQIVQLLRGGTLEIIPESIRSTGKELLRLLDRIDLFDCTPSQLELLIDEGLLSKENAPQVILVGGEAISLSLWQRLTQSKYTDFYNLYGPTETTVDVTIANLACAGKKPVIGRPLNNTEIYILDSKLQPVPIGLPGELCIGGIGLARGYLNRPELTAQKFISHPFREKNGERLYKTGDIVRYLADGEIEYLGRRDNQVKIRGFRIETAEIEALLLLRPEVKSVCVISREDIPGNKILVAYILPQPQITPDINELKRFLQQKLPGYMIPQSFVLLKSMPLNSSGKIDWRALPVPNLPSERIDKYVAPLTPIEEILAIIWTDLLKQEQIGRYDSFFELGGHSLLATQLVSRIRSNFQVELAMPTVFTASTIAELGQEIKQLQQQKLDLTKPLIFPRARDGKDWELPLSFAQMRIWFLAEFEPNSALYNIPLALSLEGDLQVKALEASLTEIIERHEALRTNFIDLEGQPVQVIRSKSDWKLAVENLQSLSPPEQESTFLTLARQQAIAPFDLGNESLIRGTLVVFDEQKSVLLICMHHIVSDGWSRGIFLEELAKLYQAKTQDLPSPLKKLPIQYADFALWQRQWLTGKILASQLGYWEKELAEAPALLPLPTDRPRPAVPSFRGKHQEFVLGAELSQELNKLSQEEGATLFMTLLAAFDVLLYRYTAQTDILVGSPIANRNQREIEGLIGCFINTLVIRTDLSGEPSFLELLQRVKAKAIAAYAHQDLPFERLVEALEPERDLSYTPLFQVMFVLQNAPMPRTEIDKLSLSYLEIENETAKFDLTLSIENQDTGLVGTWEYNTDLFDGSSIERMTGHFISLLSGIIANPKLPITRLPLLTEKEQDVLLGSWSKTTKSYHQERSIHQLFEQQVARSPSAIAVTYEGEKLTYEQLNHKANQLAHYLRRLGVKADSLVGLCAARSLEMVIAIIAILKAGGAYVPLDPACPQERLKFIAEDAQIEALLIQENLLELIPNYQGKIICLDRDWASIAETNKANLEETVTANDLAYIIYTSGSTGKPKGVLVNHSNVIRLFAATEDWYHFNQQDVWTLFHSYAFDFSVWEIWGALLHGGRLVVVPYLITRSPEPFYRLLCQEKVTILNQTPSAFRQLIQAEQVIGKDLDQDLKLRLVIFGGEALEINSLQPWWERHGDQYPQLVNMYGITETTVHVTYRPLSIADLQGTASVIGRPIPDLQVYLLDSYLQPVPIGVPGEMYVGGAGVTRGYLNRGELTAERFISSPLNNSILYKTGDQARYLSNGDLEYLGRIDNQVKIRGFRIELGEIEALLASHPQVWETVVLVREDTPGDKRLVAYLVPQPDIKLKIEEIRQFMQSKLPDYMIPNAFVLLGTLTLTANGKVDRRALPAPDFDSERLGNYVAPQTPMEEKLVTIWEQVLKVEQVGINDNFFELGGHSLLVTQLVSRIRDTFNIEIPLRDLFIAPTVTQLAESIEQSQQQNSKPTTIPAIIPRRKR